MSPSRPPPSSSPPPSAVILAAGEGSRLHAATALPKPLLKVAGLSLLERNIRTLAARGIGRVRVVVGHRAAEVERHARDLAAKLEGDTEIEIIRAEDSHLGNGASLRAGARNLEGPFLLAMADHVMTTAFVREFLERVNEAPGDCHLAIDRRIDDVFDLDDATRVKTSDGRIVDIGKELSDYDAIDTGLFYFAAGSAGRIASRPEQSVSGIVAALRAHASFRATPVTASMWQDVDTPDMAREAERRLLRTLVKPTDGPVSRYLNRPVSLAVSKHLARWHVRPNSITTFVMLLTFVAAGIVAIPSYLALVVGGLIFHLASILDGCDGEVSRLRMSGSRMGAFYDTVSDHIRYAVFYAALGVHCYLDSSEILYLWIAGVGFAATSFAYGRLARHMVRSQEHLTNLVVSAEFDEMCVREGGLWLRVLRPLRVLVKQDVQAFGVMLLLVVGLPYVVFAVTTLGSVVIAVAVLKTLRDSHAPEGRFPIELIGALVGLAAVAVLVETVPLAPVGEALESVGWKLGWVLAVAPLWFLANGLALGAILPRCLSLRELLYVQTVGEGYNALLPLAGLGGEPFKAVHLAQSFSAGQVRQVLVLDRLLQSASGAILGAILALASAALVELPTPWHAALIAGGASLAVIGAVLILASFTSGPDRAARSILRHLHLPAASTTTPIERPRIAAALLFKLTGRALNLVEVWVILGLVGVPVDASSLLLVGSFLLLSSVFFFFVPQGIGANEAGVTGAFTLLGFNPVLGLTFGIIRRARVVIWALVGVALHALSYLVSRLRSGPGATNPSQASPS